MNKKLIGKLRALAALSHQAKELVNTEFEQATNPDHKADLMAIGNWLEKIPPGMMDSLEWLAGKLEEGYHVYIDDDTTGINERVAA